MNRWISKILIVLLLWEVPVSALHAKNKPTDENAKNVEETKSSLEIDPKDIEFSKNSATAEKFFFKDIPRDLGGSMKEAFWGWGALGFGLGAGLTAGLYQVDDDIQYSFSPHALFGSTGDSVISWTFSPYTIGGVSLFTWIAAAKTGHPKLAITCKTLTEALILSMGIDTVAKFSFRRQRPNGGSLGFPSGHATAAFTAAGVLTTLYGWKAGVPSYAMASLVSIARVDGYDHFLSDVVMGAVLGTVIGVGAAKWQKKEHPNFFVYPQVTHDRATIGFTYTY